MQSPSTVHASDNFQAAFYRRYLFQEFLSLFKFEIPDEWSLDYLQFTLFIWGYLVIFKTDEFGVIPQQCGLTGFDIFYRPTTATVANPQLRKNYNNLQIGKNCVVVKMSPDYCGVWDLINFYADQMAIAIQSFSMNLLNTKFAYVFGAKNKAIAESFKKMFDEVSAGNPAVVVDKNLFNSTTGELDMSYFNRDVKSSFIANDILETMRKIKVMFFNDIGVPNANTEKKERLVIDEVNANNIETQVKYKLWLSEIERSFKKANEMFNLNLSVKPTFGGDNNVNKSVSIVQL